MTMAVRALSCFQRILFGNRIFIQESLTLALRTQPKLWPWTLALQDYPTIKSALHTSSVSYMPEDNVNKFENETESETSIDESANDLKQSKIEEDPSTSLVFNGIPFDDIPIANIKATWNNTHIIVVDPTVTKNIVSKATCGSEGFKNAKKGTSVAAQTAAIAAATKAVEKGVKMVRVLVKGIGPGRQASIKGLQMGGLEIISITDNTPVPHNGCRPRKARRL